MTAPLGAPGFGQTPNSDLQTKFVDKAPPTLGFRQQPYDASGSERAIWLRPEPAHQVLARTGFLGNHRRKEALWADISRSPIERGRELAERHNAENLSASTAAWSDADRAAAEVSRLAEEWAELNAEEAGRPAGPLRFTPSRLNDIPWQERNHEAVVRFLPPELAPFLTRMHPTRRREREQAILAYVGWEGLELLGLAPTLLADEAARRAAQYATRFPAQNDQGDSINQQTVHRKGRCEKWQRRKLVKKQTKALLYVEQALGAVGGPNTPGRPLYVSDYAVTLHRAQVQRTAEILEGLRLVLVEDPTVQIPMSDLNERAKVADVTKRRLLIDMLLHRFADLGWHVCWITITLPGRYVCHATNEENRVEQWDPRLGPQEALDAIQEMHHQTMALLRERGVRPCGWWNAQPQQSGTPHRHIVVACRTREDAHAVCDAFWSRFSSTPPEERQDERKRATPGCAAYVIGDEDPRYAPPRGKNGRVETAASIARYAARYSTRYEAPVRTEDQSHAPAKEHNLDTGEMSGEQERYNVWKTRRRVRGHTWIGFDSGRSPMEQWDTLWANAMRSDYEPEDARMALALRLMRETQAHAENAAESRRRASGMASGRDRDEELACAQESSDLAAVLAWHAGIAMGLWPDTDLDPTELEWLRNETTLEDALPPMPLRVEKETVYGEQRRTVIGCVAPEPRFALSGRLSVKSLMSIAEELGVDIVGPKQGKVRSSHVLSALKRAGFGLSRRPNGTRIGFDLSGEVLLRTEKEWKIVDTATADKMVADAEAAARSTQGTKPDEAAKSNEADQRVDVAHYWIPLAYGSSVDDSSHIADEELDHLSDNPTDPRYGPKGAALEVREPPG